jgi:glycosyltransferase involved in cell wall biosynthesis
MYSLAHLPSEAVNSAHPNRHCTAYLVEDCWPEFDRYFQANDRDRDYLFLPVADRGDAKYNWNTSGFDRVFEHRSILLIRTLQSILLRILRQGAKYQQFRLIQARYLAHLYGRRLTDEMTHLVVSQSLLPYLWQAGHLRGRSFDVLMTALPIDFLQQRLDLAATLHPQSPTLNNFRVLPEIAAWEMAALEQASQIITPHADLATLWVEKTRLLDWVMPSATLFEVPTLKPTVVLPSASLGRKGIYELKAALTGLDVNLIVCGSELEQPGFWQGLQIEYLADYLQALSRATVVVSPAWVEHQPRRILQSIACGIPTIVSNACGLHGLPDAIEIPQGDITALRAAIQSILSKSICQQEIV